MHMHAPLVLGMATGTAWSFGLFVVSTTRLHSAIADPDYFMSIIYGGCTVYIPGKLLCLTRVISSYLHQVNAQANG